MAATQSKFTQLQQQLESPSGYNPDMAEDLTQSLRKAQQRLHNADVRIRVNTGSADSRPRDDSREETKERPVRPYVPG